MTILSPQPKPSILHTAAAKAVNLEVKSDPGTPCLNLSGGLRTSCISLKFAPGARRELNLQKEIKWPYQWGKGVMQRWGMWRGQINHRIWRDLKKNGYPSSALSSLIVKRMDCRLTSLHLSQSSICKLSSFPFQEDKASGLYREIPRNTGGERPSVSPWSLFLIVGERLTPT